MQVELESELVLVLAPAQLVVVFAAAAVAVVAGGVVVVVVVGEVLRWMVEVTGRLPF